MEPAIEDGRRRVTRRSSRTPAPAFGARAHWRDNAQYGQPVRVERTTHAHLTTEADSKGWDGELVRATVYVFFCCTGFGRAKIGYTHAGPAGVRRRLAYMRRKRELPDLDTSGTVDLGDCTDVEGWAREEAIRLWLVHRQNFRWDPWQDWLVVPKGLDGG
jgi:hypothetical protein